MLEVFSVLRMGPGGYVTTPLLWSPTQAGGATFHKRGLEIQKPSSHIVHGPAERFKINQKKPHGPNITLVLLFLLQCHYLEGGLGYAGIVPDSSSAILRASGIRDQFLS